MKKVSGSEWLGVFMALLGLPPLMINYLFIVGLIGKPEVYETKWWVGVALYFLGSLILILSEKNKG